jgi:hypothetical protein
MTDLKKGDRIELLAMPDDPSPMPAGATGTVLGAVEHDFGPRDRWTQVHVRWDAPHAERTLSLTIPPDVVRRLA